MKVLFLDDVRDPYPGTDVLVARNCLEAQDLVLEQGVPETLSLDHDLGEGQPTAMAFLWWLIDRHLDGDIDLRLIKRVIIHSANPVGAANLKGLWDGFVACELQNGVQAELKPRV